VAKVSASGRQSLMKSFVSVTQSFDTTSSMGRLTLNVLLSFAQFEREVSESAKMTGQDQNATAPARHRAQSAKMNKNNQQNRASPAGDAANMGGATPK
jgi:DNA invertase Pin-like site-specific DNA recombinase